MVLLIIFFIFSAFFASFNPSILTLTLFLFAGTFFPLPECRYARLYEIAKSRKKIIPLQTYVVDGNVAVKKLNAFLRRGKRICFEIVSHGKKLGTIDESDLLFIPSELYATASVLECYYFLQKNR
jgi:hypothetical protein